MSNELDDPLTTEFDFYISKQLIFNGVAGTIGLVVLWMAQVHWVPRVTDSTLVHLRWWLGVVLVIPACWCAYDSCIHCYYDRYPHCFKRFKHTSVPMQWFVALSDGLGNGLLLRGVPFAIWTLFPWPENLSVLNILAGLGFVFVAWLVSFMLSGMIPMGGERELAVTLGMATVTFLLLFATGNLPAALVHEVVCVYCMVERHRRRPPLSQI